MSIERSLLATVGSVLTVAGTVAKAAGGPRVLLGKLGWALPPGVDDIGLAALELDRVGTQLQAWSMSASDPAQDAPAQAEALADLATAVADTLSELADLSLDAPQDYLDRTGIVDDFVPRMFDLALIQAAAAASRPTFDVAVLLGWFELIELDADPASFQVAHLRHVVRWDRLPTLLTDPQGLFRDVYGWGTERFDADALVLRLGAVVQHLAIGVRHRKLPEVPLARLHGGPPPPHPPLTQLFLPLLGSTGPASGEAGLTVFGLPPTTAGGVDGGVGIAPYAAGTADLRFPLSSRLSIRLAADADLGSGIALVLRAGADPDLRTGLNTEQAGVGGPGARVDLEVAFAVPDGADPVTLLSGAGATATARSLALRISVAVDEGGADAAVRASLAGGRLSLTPEGLPFLDAALPAEGLTATADLEVSWSHRDGVRLAGRAELEATLAVGRRLGPLTLDLLRIAVGTTGEQLTLTASLAARLALGPVLVVVDGVGVRAALGPGPGSLGSADLTVRPSRPTSIGLALDAGVAKGGGFVFLDPDGRTYAGVLELELDLPATGKIAVKAIGVLTTELPGPEDDWALLLLLFAQFRWQLGWGFTLNGLGGIVGLHHRPDPLALSEGLKGGVIDDLLFPENPVADAPRIIPALRAVFPLEQDTFTVGPALELGWGTPTLVHLRLGLLFEIDHALGGAEPSTLSKVVVLGQLLVQVPPKDTGAPPIVRLLIDVVGWYDYDEEWLFFRARLRDSKVAGFALTGELVVSVESGQEPTLICAAGGFHPSFADVPRGVPATLDRLGFGLALGPVRLEMRMYYAITPNAKHLGIDIALVAKLGLVSIEGHLGFDALADTETDRFVAQVRFAVALKFKGRSLCGVRVDMTLTGPGEWRAVGAGSFEVLWWDVDFDFDERWGEEPALPGATVALREQLAAAASSPVNWSARLPPGLSPPITVEIPAAGLVAHPLGELTFLQGLAPLGVEVSRVGAKRVAGGPVTFAAAGPTLNGSPVASAPAREHFARGQFVDLDEEQALTGRAFELFEAGLTIGAPGFRAPAGAAGLGRAPLAFEDRYLVPEDEPHPDPDPRLRGWRVVSLGTTTELTMAFAGGQARGGGAGRSARLAAAALAGDGGRRVSVREPALALVDVEALAPLAGAAPDTVTAGEQLAASRPGTLLVEAWEGGG